MTMMRTMRRRQYDEEAGTPDDNQTAIRQGEGDEER